MSNIIRDEFFEYTDTKSNFEKFHNQVINMPRDSFSDTSLNKLRSLSAYLLLIEGIHDSINGNNYKQIMYLVSNQLRELSVSEELKSSEYEERYFRTDVGIDALYEAEGRMFRHLMSICAFFGMISSLSRQKKVINFHICREYILSDSQTLMPVFRNNLISNNIKDNDFIKSLKGINLKRDADYSPAYAILRYLNEIQRKATIFEVSLLLGRVDDKVQKLDEILSRALKIGRTLPTSQEAQIKHFFGCMGWKNSEGLLYDYAASQEPHFKFKNFILFMETFQLLKFDHYNGYIELSDYSENILRDQIPLEILDLEKLLYKIDDDSQRNAELYDLIIRKRSAAITEAIRKDTKLVEKINLRSIRLPEIDEVGKRKRNRIISEIAKIKADYTCEATGRKTFKTPTGLYYVEAHHILEFSTESGPDITDNLIVLGPEKHKLIHLASREEIDDLYNHLKSHGVLSIDRFIRMHEIYNALTENHIRILFEKKIISSMDKEMLSNLIINGRS